VRMLEFFLQRCCPKSCSKTSVQRVDLLHIEFKLRSLNYQTPFYAGCILKYQENYYKIHFSVDNSCNFITISKSNISKQINKED
jgi:hypothetical protein